MSNTDTERAAIAQPAEPVATYMGHRSTPEGTREFWGIAPRPLEPGTPLYTAAPTARQPLNPQPLTLDAIRKWAQRRVKAASPAGVTDPVAWLEEGVRWAEGQHGITQEGE